MDNAIAFMTEQICSYILDNASSPIVTDAASADSFDSGVTARHRKATSLVRVHNEKLLQYGDFSFPRNGDIWLNYFAQEARRANAQPYALFAADPSDTEAQDARASFVAAAANWRVPVSRLHLTNERCLLFLQRNAVTEQLLRHVLLPATDSDAGGSLHYGQLRKQPEKRVQLREDAQEDGQKLSHYRARLIRETLRKVLAYSAWNLVDSAAAVAPADTATEAAAEEDVLQLQVLSINAKNVSGIETGVVTIKCGIVTDRPTGKHTQLSTQDYMNIRSHNMYQTAVHKYGIRAQYEHLLERLGAAAVSVDLLEVKHSSPVHAICNTHGSTKGASFILYNSARLETLLRTFDERVSRSDYGQLPALENVDLSLLKEEEEWQLIFGYIFGFPNLIERCVEQLEQGTCATHLIVRFLSGFVAIFSVYYRRIRILTDKRLHLMPLVYARIYLIKAVREILNKTLALLDIEPVQFM